MQVSEIAEYNRLRQAEVDERRSMRMPAEEPDEMDLGEAWNGTPSPSTRPSSSHPNR